MPLYTRRPEDISTPPVISELEPSARFEFPKMLFKMLEDCTFDEKYCKIVSWRPHGLAFKVHNRDELEKILHKWFREKYESFRCLLEQWGFLKLSRGKDRGCWYHKKFYHRSDPLQSKSVYEKIEKEDFIEQMPTYLSFRNEPDLEKESSVDSRIPPEKIKFSVATVKISGPNKEITNPKNKVTKRYAASALKECRYCHEIFVAQGLPNHEQACRLVERKRKHVNESEGGDNDGDNDEDDDENDDDNADADADADSGRNTLSESDTNQTFTSKISHSNDKIKCRYCKNYFSKYGVKKHETYCKSVIKDNDSEDSLEQRKRFPCRFCGTFFTKVGVQLHERACKFARSNNLIGYEKKDLREIGNESNHTGSVLSDDSSVDSLDSIQSGCRICGFDDDHANLLLCEGCDTELHTYCLNPALEKVPVEDWFCDSCKLRMENAEEELGDLIRKVPTDMAERFGEICFAKSAENAHWWPALIFDPRSFLHNRQVVDLAHRNLGKRYLVFFFENQNAFAAIKKTWIMTWEEGVEKEYDKGKSVKNASKCRREQFDRAMNLASEAFQDGDSELGETEFDSMMETDVEEHVEEQSLSSRIPREIGGDATIFDLRPDFDWKSVRDAVRKEVEAASPSEYPEYPEKFEKLFQTVSVRHSGKSQAQLKIGERQLYIGMFSEQNKAAYAVQLFRQKLDAAIEEFEKDDTTLAPDSGFGDTTYDRKKASHDFASSGADSLSKTSDFPFGSFTDKRPFRWRHRSVAKTKRKTQKDTAIDHILQQMPQKKTEKPEEKLDSQQDKTDLQLQIPPPKPQPPPPPLSDQERNELLLSTPFCQYYLLPLSQL